MPGYTVIMMNGLYDGPYEEELNVYAPFSLAEVLHPDVKKLIPDEFDLSRPLGKFYYSCDCQCFCQFYSNNRFENGNKIFIYADTNEWEMIYVLSKDGTKMLTINDIIKQLIIYNVKKGYENDNDKPISQIDCKLSSEQRSIDSKWLNLVLNSC
jgi:hypothetical protein